MTKEDQEFDEQLAEARARHLESMNAITDATNRHAAAMVAALPGSSAGPRYQWMRQTGAEENNWQPVPPGPDWALDSWHEGESHPTYMWRRTIDKE